MKHSVLSLLFSAALLMSACGNAANPSVDSGDPKTTSGDTDTGTAEDTTEEVIHYEADIPEQDFEKTPFRVLTVLDSTNAGKMFDVEEDDGDIVRSAIYKRNRTIEERYNTVFQMSDDTYTNNMNKLKSCVNAGDNEYEMIMLVNRDAFTAFQNNFLYDYADIPYIDPSQPWYIHNINEAFAVGDVQTLLYSDECLTARIGSQCVYFNKQMIQNNDMTSPYELVDKGTWTFENFFKMAESVIKDVNNDGKFDGEDIIGIHSKAAYYVSDLWVSTGSSLVTKDEEGIPVYTAPGDARLQDVLTALADKMKIPGLAAHNGALGLNSTSGRSFFQAGGALFEIAGVTETQYLRSMNMDFGIVPMPKYDEAQERYYAAFIDGWIHVVPNTTQNEELIGTIMEALAVESKNYVIPAFFDVALDAKYTRDTDSVRMLNIIFDNIQVDFGATVWQTSLRGNVIDCVLEGTGVTSTLTSMQKAADKLSSRTRDAILSRK